MTTLDGILSDACTVPNEDDNLMEGEGAVEVSDDDLDAELDPKENGWSKEKEESVNAM